MNGWGSTLPRRRRTPCSSHLGLDAFASSRTRRETRKVLRGSPPFKELQRIGPPAKTTISASQCASYGENADADRLYRALPDEAAGRW